MSRYLRRTLPREFTVLAGPEPTDDLGLRSDRLQILWNCTDEPWADAGQHCHTDSDEVVIVLTGSLAIEAGDEVFTVHAGEVCCFPAGVPHAITGGVPPIEALVIRAPALADKVGHGDDDR